MKEEVIELDTVDKYNKFFILRSGDVSSHGYRGRPFKDYSACTAIYHKLWHLCLVPERYALRRHYLRPTALRLSGRNHCLFCTGTGGFHPRAGRNASHRIRTALPSGLDSWYPTGTRYPELFFFLLRTGGTISNQRILEAYYLKRASKRTKVVSMLRMDFENWKSELDVGCMYTFKSGKMHMSLNSSGILQSYIVWFGRLCDA